jgi:FkbM family methyltransferase
MKRNKLISFEPEFKLLKQFIKRGDVFIDVGSNIGKYSFEAGKIVGHSGVVYSFEPNVEICNLSASLGDKVGFQNIVYIPFGVFSTSGFKKFKLDKSAPKDAWFSTHTRSKFLKSSSGSYNQIKYVVKLDTFKFTPRLIKIDVEGAELEVLKGSKKTIQRHKPVLIIEDNNPIVIEFLADLNYFIYKLDSSRNIICIHSKDLLNSFTN